MQFESPTGARRETLLRRGVAYGLARSALEVPEPGGAPVVTAGDVHRAVMGIPGALEKLEDAARNNPKLWQTFEAALARQPIADFPQLRAADTGGISAREVGGWRIELRTPATRTDRVYLVIAVPAGAAAPTILFAQHEKGWASIQLSEPEESVIQHILSPDHPVVQAIRNRDARLTLR